MITKIESIINTIILNKGIILKNKINKKTLLRDEIGLDSLDLAELTVRIEAEFGVDVFEDGIVNTVGEIIKKLSTYDKK